MRVIQHRSHTMRTALYFTAVSGVPLLLATLLVSTHTYEQSGWWLSVLILSLALFGKAFPFAKRFTAGALGEARAVQALKHLGDEFTAVTNFVVPRTRRGDIDLILIGPMGVLALEVKSYRGTVIVEEGRWWRLKPNGAKMPIKNIGSQARTHRKALASYLRKTLGRETPVEAMVVFNGLDNLVNDESDLRVIHLRELCDLLDEMPTRLEPEHAAAVANALQGRGAKPPAKPADQTPLAA